MVNFAELKQKAEKAKDAGVTKMVNTKDRYSSVPSAKTNWDPNWKRPPPSTPTGSASTHRHDPPSPPPLRTRPESTGGSIASPPPPVSRGSRPDAHPPPSFSSLPPPTRAKSTYSPQRGSTEQVDHIDWANLSQEDKDEFFSWLDEFFSRYLNITLPPERELPSVVMRGSLPSVSRPPPVNLNSRPLS
ncbi:hypothetical protein K503DRAFT_774642 [Rhizopogon vinicolor AM-OR11-026]|uniref:Uncharacterized protein n=1 Tax=Rhizopogon vinicolor AM-OR11-026 TaxID=1314800 RepID=A0A1B7MP72_9AGAM|nr:hypothetical protein K503DRAFT_774642 [Rhizopogon vinicolor AM-OR11-026]